MATISTWWSFTISDNHLTPGHLLIGGRLISVPQEEISKPTSNKLDRLTQRVAQAFWKRWYTDYLQELQTQNKWRKLYPNLSTDTVVFLKDNTQIPVSWSMGRVLEGIPDEDGLVWVVRVQTNRGVFDIIKREFLYLKNKVPLH